MNQYESQGVKIVSCYDERYPECFKLLEAPPLLLYCRGNVDLLNNRKAVAVIGTRNPTYCGKIIAYRTAEYFASNNFIIVSGLAVGIDTCAHKGAVDSHAKTIAVLTDVANIYPKENSSLALKIINSGGLLIAENAPGSRIKGYHFVARDRLQAALSLGIFALEAGTRSGTRHAVNEATKLKIPVFCPDIPKLIQLGKYRGDEEQIKGIAQWLRIGTAAPYTRNNYASIMTNLLNEFHKTGNRQTNQTLSREQYLPGLEPNSAIYETKKL